MAKRSKAPEFDMIRRVDHLHVSASLTQWSNGPAMQIILTDNARRVFVVSNYRSVEEGRQRAAKLLTWSDDEFVRYVGREIASCPFQREIGGALKQPMPAAA